MNCNLRCVYQKFRCDRPGLLVDKLPIGTYILRDIAPANNQKLEDHGHTMVYIKEDMIGFYYDPNTGVKDLYLKNHGDELWSLLEDNYNHFHVTHFRFYRLD